MLANWAQVVVLHESLIDIQASSAAKYLEISQIRSWTLLEHMR